MRHAIVRGHTLRLVAASLIVALLAFGVVRVRNMLRGSLARAVLERQVDEERRRAENHSHWYTVNVAKLPEHLSALFRPSEEDDETVEFLDNCYDKSDSFFLQLYHSVALPVLKLFLTQTSANGLLGRGSMFVLSASNFRRLVAKPAGVRSGSLIDLGAGDGVVTAKMAEHFADVFATETSAPMQWRLRQRGYTVLDIDDWASGERRYDVVSCLNVLDRCERPLTLLRQIHDSLAQPGGRAVIAVVLPFSTYVEATASKQPAEDLGVNGRTKEEQLTSLASAFAAASLAVESFTRVPYLCEGDMHRAFYLLDDYVFVLKRSGD